MAKKKKESKSDAAGGLVFVGSLMLGLGLGMFYGAAGVGVILGLGLGFFLMGIIKAMMR